jgi:hypothetical protein
MKSGTTLATDLATEATTLEIVNLDEVQQLQYSEGAADMLSHALLQQQSSEATLLEVDNAEMEHSPLNVEAEDPQKELEGSGLINSLAHGQDEQTFVQGPTDEQDEYRVVETIVIHKIYRKVPVNSNSSVDRDDLLKYISGIDDTIDRQ